MLNTEVICPYCGELKIGEIMKPTELTPIPTCAPCYGLALCEGSRILEHFRRITDTETYLDIRMWYWRQKPYERFILHVLEGWGESFTDVTEQQLTDAYQRRYKNKLKNIL